MFGFFDWSSGIMEKVKTENEIFRLRQQLREARELLEKIVCVKEPDDGVILLDHESPSRWNDDLQCFVYKYEHFSQLGDALIELHEKLKEQKR